MALKPDDLLLNGQYRIVRELGSGGFGAVYLAQDMLLGEEVAIKELTPTLVADQTMLRRFLAEAKATMRLTHERIVRTHNVFSAGGNYYIAMEYMAGGSLGARMQGRGPLAVDEAVHIAAQVCEGLHYAHQRGVVHCDLKPANILFDAKDAAKVADFGIAHVSDRLLTRTWQTSVGFVAGTLPYMSPEQANGVRDNPRIDVYALGAVLYRMLTGRTYLDFDQRETPGAQADNVLRIRTQKAPPPSAYNRLVPVWLDRVVLKSLDKQPANRYANAAELRAALLQPRPAAPPRLQRSQPTPPAQPTAQPARSRRAPLPTWSWLAMSGVAVLCLVIVVTIALALNGGSSDRETPVVALVVTPQITPTPLSSPEPPTPTPPPSPVLPTPTLSLYYYQDDFDDPQSGWGVSGDEDAWAGYFDGEYRLEVHRPDFMAWASPEREQVFSDFEVEVDARLVEGPLDNNYGVLVRYQPNERSFYWFQISSDGFYSVDLFLEEEFVNLISWEPSEAINMGVGATNELRVVCKGNQYSFYVNDTFLVNLTDSSLSLGDIGLAAGTFDESGVVVHFDHIRVRGPQE